MENKNATCCFTGHRPQKLPWGYNENDPGCLALKEELLATLDGIYQSGYKNFLCGMAIGCDMYFAEAVLKLREQYPDITLKAVIPCASQPDKWKKSYRIRYNSIIDRCNEVEVLQIFYTNDCMQKRNKYMVDNSSLLLSCFNGYPGGTMSTIVYAQRSGLKVITIDI